MATKRERFDDWKAQLSILIEKEMEVPFDDLVEQLHIQEEMYEYWREGSSVKDFYREVVVDLDEDTEPEDTFKITWEL